ncbi:MAG: hypothetical protein EOO05_11160, partial [Chitinophagaceae bacterium]
MTTLEQQSSVAAARQSMNPQTNEEHGNIMPDEEKMEEAFNLTASHNIDDPKDKKTKDDDDKNSNENPNNGAMDDEEVTDGET